MKFAVDREQLLRPLNQVSGVVERRQTMPILSNVLLQVNQGLLTMTGTDLEIELVSRTALVDAGTEGDVTVPARKLLDLVKSLPAASAIEFRLDQGKLIGKSGRSRFSLATLPANEFPNLEESTSIARLTVDRNELKRMIDRTAFAMAQQDVRYYLNGMLFEVSDNTLKTIATDGHRLALCSGPCQADSSQKLQVIVPRKGVLELSRLLSDMEGDVQISVGNNHIRVTAGTLTFTSKLIDGKFPDYERVLPKATNRVLLAKRDSLRQALLRAAILSNEKYKGVRFITEAGIPSDPDQDTEVAEVATSTLKILASNPDQEEAEEEISVSYTGAALEIGFNVSYMLDVLNVLEADEVHVSLGDSNSSALVHDEGNDSAIYVVMPMRL